MQYQKNSKIAADLHSYWFEKNNCPVPVSVCLSIAHTNQPKLSAAHHSGWTFAGLDVRHPPKQGRLHLDRHSGRA